MQNAISLEEATARALKNNLDLQVELMRKSLAQKQLNLASYDMLPKLVTNLNYNSRSNFSGASSRSLITGRRTLEPSSLMSIKPGTPFSLVIPKRVEFTKKLDIGIEEMEQIALESRPELRELFYKKRANAKETRVAILQMLPGIEVRGDYNYSSNSFLFNGDWLSLGAQLSWNLISLISMPAKLSELEDKEKLLDIERLSASMAVLAQLHISLARFSNIAQEYRTAYDYLKAQNRIIELTRIETYLGKTSEHKLLHEEMNTLLAEVRCDYIHSELENAYSGIYVSLGLDPISPHTHTLAGQLTGYSLPNGPISEIAFIDTSVSNYSEILAGIDPNIQVVLLDSHQDGIRQISDYLSGHEQVNAIHIISHGSEGQLNLGTSALTRASMTDDYVDALNNIRQVLSEQADILIYGCNFAEGQTGQEAAALLSQLTGADVAASTDTTGYAGLGGNWALETRTGLIETHLAVNNEVQADWVGLLAVNDAPTFDVGTGIVTTAVGPESAGRGVTVQADGKIVVAGYTYNGSNDTFALIRYDSNGTLDTSFGTGGIVTTAVGASSSGESVTLQADGKIVVAGRGGSSGSRTFALTRYDSNGSFDMTFNPVVNTLGGTVSFTENGTPIVLDNNAAILDDELSTLNNFAGATLALARNAGANSEDVYSASGTLSFAGGNVTVGGTTIGTVTTNSGGTLALTFNASATNALVNSALQQIAYSNVRMLRQPAFKSTGPSTTAIAAHRAAVPHSAPRAAPPSPSPPSMTRRRTQYRGCRAWLKIRHWRSAVSVPMMWTAT